MKKAMDLYKKIMIADDDSSILDVVSSMLEFAGYEVVHSPTAALPLQPGLPDLFLLDIWIDGVDGREVCRRLKNDTATGHIPVILFSASKGIGHSALLAGADDFLEKPFQMTDLLEKIENLLTAEHTDDSGAAL